MIRWPWRRRKAVATQVYGGHVAAGRDVIIHAGETDPVVRLSNAARDFMSRADMVWTVHAAFEINGERGPAFRWEERALIHVDEALVKLRAEAARAGALRPDLAVMADQIATYAHSARQFCIEDYVPEEHTTSHFVVHLNELRTTLTELISAAA
ncbi:hypothetical protein [Streptomyces sp. NPDC048350]|uniref:hypothetical protein n=1 Tax=Streptomyces sp. NPDC048350 TaxID=3365538 RepID=UPI00371F286D